MKSKCLVSNYSRTTTVNIYVLGDFNLPGINWETITSINSQEVMFLDLLDKLILNSLLAVQLTKVTTRRILSYRMWINYLYLLESNFFPMITQSSYLVTSIDLIDAYFKSGFSCSSFNAQAFIFYLSELFKFLSFNDMKTLNYPGHWCFYLQESFSNVLKRKN